MLQLRQVVADVERSASLAVVSSVKLHNKQRWVAAASVRFPSQPPPLCRRFQEREEEIAKLSNSVLEMNFVLARLLKQDESLL